MIKKESKGAFFLQRKGFTWPKIKDNMEFEIPNLTLMKLTSSVQSVAKHRDTKSAFSNFLRF